MKRALLPLTLAFLLTTAACAEDGPVTAAGAGASAAAAAPTIAGIDLQEQGESLVLLTARASDAANRPLTFRWRVDAGALSTDTGRAVFWRVPKEAGTYTASLEVSTPSGGNASATQRFTVSAAGKVAAQGGIQVRTAAAGGSAFVIPSPVGSIQPNPPVVAANPNAVPGSPPPPAPVLAQPVATPTPPQSPAAPVVQPIALPLPTTPPPVLPPSPLPLASPLPAAPGVPAPLREFWRDYDSALIPLPSANNWHALHFPRLTRGWIAGGRGVVLRYDKAAIGDAEPPLTARNTGVPASAQILQIHFSSDNIGFLSGAGGLLMRTMDGGATWQDVAPPPPIILSEIPALVVFNDRIVTFCDKMGRVYRTESGNDASALNVQNSWQLQPSKPNDRPSEWANLITAGCGFATDDSLCYFVGDAIYRLDVDAAPAERWRRVQLLKTTGAPDPTDPVDPQGLQDLGDGQALCVKSVANNQVWVGTFGGTLYRSTNANQATPAFTRLKSHLFRNREDNGNGLYHERMSSITALSAVDTNNIFLGAGGIFDSDDGGQTWRRTARLANFLTAMQVNFDVSTGTTRFRGFGVSQGGHIYQYK